MNSTPNTPRLISEALKIGTLKLVFKRNRIGWAAYVPSKMTKDGDVETLSNIKLCDFNHMTLRRLRFTVASRYLAQVHEDSGCCFINLRWALKLPNWGTNSYGAMREIATAMERAGLISIREGKAQS